VLELVHVPDLPPARPPSLTPPASCRRLALPCPSSGPAGAAPPAPSTPPAIPGTGFRGNFFHP
jgi:hypothetical protein